MTDLAKHFDFIASLKSLQPGAAPDAALALTMAIKGADLGHSVKPWDLHYKWSLWVTDEFFRLGDAERAAGLPISTFCDRENTCDCFDLAKRN